MTHPALLALENATEVRIDTDEAADLASASAVALAEEKRGATVTSEELAAVSAAVALMKEAFDCSEIDVEMDVDMEDGADPAQRIVVTASTREPNAVRKLRKAQIAWASRPRSEELVELAVQAAV